MLRYAGYKHRRGMAMRYRAMILAAGVAPVLAVSAQAQDKPAVPASGDTMLKVAVPLGDPVDWVKPDDYPNAAFHENRMGTVEFRLAVAPNGVPTGCTVTLSSGFADLDTATFDLVTQRARFESDKDGAGKPIAGYYTNRIRWFIPKDDPPNARYDVTRRRGQIRYRLEWPRMVDS